MLPTPVLSVSGKGFARLRISAWHFSPAPPILYAVRAIVYHKSRVLSRVLRDFSGERSPRNPAPEPEAALAVPAAVVFGGGLNPGGTCSPCRCGALRGACFVCRLPTLPLPSVLPPIPPPPSPPGKGEIFSLFRRGLRPRHPGTYLLTALTDHAKQAPGAGEPKV